MNKDEFYLKVAMALSSCQLIEQELKLYVTEALELAQKCIGDKMSFKMTGRDYENSSLEGLIKVFKNLSNNEILVAELYRFKDERNFLSHQGITHCLDYEGDLFESTAFKYQDRLAAIENQSKKLLREINLEANKFRAHLWFDDHV